MLFGHSDDGQRNHFGPDHQILWFTSYVGNIPWDAQSPGFSTLFTCRHLSGGNKSIITDILMPTNCSNNHGLPFSQSSTIVLSVQVNTLKNDIFSTSLTWCRIFVRRYAPQSSKRGIINLLIGAIFVLPIPMRYVLCPQSQSFECRQHQQMHPLKHHKIHATGVPLS